jgi:hypothetical protein
MNVALGWRFYSADFSINAGDPLGMKRGSVTLIRDPKSRESWNAMSIAEQEEFALFVTGSGVDFHRALQDANASALSQKNLE